MELTPGQHQAIHADARRICVDAGAGSGKTYVLVQRIVRLLEQGIPLDAIVAITFTEKAAAEMKARLRAACRKRALDADTATMSRWRDQERAVETARITTIHAFCAGVLREHALTLGIDPDFSPLSEGETRLMVVESARTALHALLEANDDDALHLCSVFLTGELVALLSDLLLKEQLLDRITAHASGADVASLRAAWQAAARLEQEQALVALKDSPALAAYRNALAEFGGAYQGEAPDGRQLHYRWQMRLLTLLRKGASLETLQPLLDERSSLGVNRAGKGWDKETAADLKALMDEVTKWLDKVLPLFRATAEEEEKCARLTLALGNVLTQAREVFNTSKQRGNKLSFDELIARVHAALTRDATLCASVARDMRVLLVDEFQDTDATQLEIAEALHAAPDGPDLFIVGDAKQSIYYFRGAEVDVFRRARERADLNIVLDANFRTVPDVLAFVNDYFGTSNALHAVELPYGPMAPSRPAATAPAVTFITVLPPPDAPGMDMASLRRLEAEHIAAQILALLDPDAAPRIRDKDSEVLRAATPGDIGLLFRGMSHVGLYEDALRRAGIPYTLSAGAGFYERQEVLDVLNALRVVLDPHDEAALLGFLRGPMAGLSDEALFRMVRRHGNLSRAFADAQPGDTGGEDALLDAARALIADLRAQAEAPPGDLVRHLLEATGFEAVQLAQYLGLQRAANLRKLIAQADGFNHGGISSLRTFVRYLADISHEGVREGEAAMVGEGGAVTLMTVHKSKGLEFPVVFVVDTASKMRARVSGALTLHRDLGLVVRAPDSEGKPGKPLLSQAIALRVQREEAAEQARLLYVALTRARDLLFVSGSLKGGRTAPGTWLDALESTYDITTREEGAPFGNPGWKATVQRAMPVARSIAQESAASADLDMTLLSARMAPVVPDASTRTAFSVSALLDLLSGATDRDEQPQADFEGSGTGRNDALMRGTLVHALFERWDFATGTGPDVAALLERYALAPAQRDAWTADLTAIATRFANSPLAKRMGASRPVTREVPFFLYLPGVDAVVQGVIDAALADGTLIDYKTGAHNATRHARYVWQLQFYAAAYREIRGAQPREGVLYYVDEDRTETVDFADAALDAALQEAAELITRLRSAATA